MTKRYASEAAFIIQRNTCQKNRAKTEILPFSSPVPVVSFFGPKRWESAPFEKSPRVGRYVIHGIGSEKRKRNLRCFFFFFSDLLCVVGTLPIPPYFVLVSPTLPSDFIVCKWRGYSQLETCALTLHGFLQRTLHRPFCAFTMLNKYVFMKWMHRSIYGGELLS